MIFQPGARIVFIGDSITDCGRRDVHAPYGDGYVSRVRELVIAAYPDRQLTWVNHGISGDTVRHLAARWQRDAIETRPDWLSVKIGINDVWRAFDGHPDEAVPLDEYETALRSLLRQAVDATGCRLILADPYVIEPDRAEPQRARTAEYAATVARLADEFGAVHVPVQQAFDRVLETTSAQAWADDRIHPNGPGHAVIAGAFLRAINWSLPA